MFGLTAQSTTHVHLYFRGLRAAGAEKYNDSQYASCYNCVRACHLGTHDTQETHNTDTEALFLKQASDELSGAHTKQILGRQSVVYLLLQSVSFLRRGFNLLCHGHVQIANRALDLAADLVTISKQLPASRIHPLKTRCVVVGPCVHANDCVFVCAFASPFNTEDV